MLLLAAAIMSFDHSVALSAQPTSTKCPQTISHYAWQRGKSVRPRKLADLPDANAYSAVYRRIGGCEAPIVVKYRVSGR